MKITWNTLSSLIFCVFFASFSFAEPPNLTLVEKELIQYHDSGTYEKDLEQAVAQAKTYLLSEIKKQKDNHEDKKLALVLDIDETSLSNYNSIVKGNFCNNKETIRQNMLKAKTPAIKPTLELYKVAMQNGVNVFFVTGRDESLRAATIKNLKTAGYSNWQALYLKPKSYQNTSIIPYKTEARADIEKKGYTIIANMGDQFSDLNGGHAEKTFKLPNPFYYLW